MDIDHVSRADGVTGLELEMNTDHVRRADGSIVEGLTNSKWEKLCKGFTYLNDEDLVYIRDWKIGRPFSEFIFKLIAGNANDSREMEDLHGIPASRATSLFMLRSVHVTYVKRKFSPFLSVCGEITSASIRDDPDIVGVYIYKRELEDVEKFESSDGFLTLNGPSEFCWLVYVGFLLQSHELSIRLYDQQKQQLFVQDKPFTLSYSENYFEEEIEEEVKNEETKIILKYVSIPMAVYGYLELRISNRKRDPNSKEFLDVCGRVVVNYKTRFGNSKSQGFVLFDKNPDLQQYEKLQLGMGKNLLSSSGSRCWVVAPACSLLHLDIDLYNRKKDHLIWKGVAVLETHNSLGSGKGFVSGEYSISVSASWATPFTQPPVSASWATPSTQPPVSASWATPSTQPPAQDGVDGKISRILEPWAPASPRPRPASAFEVFSVLLVCHEKPLQIKGHLRFTSKSTMDDNETEIDIFKREEDPLALNGSGLHTISVFDGSRLLNDSDILLTACELEDTTSGLRIRGRDCLYVDLHYGQQLCSIFQGNNGFAALHYTVFSSAVQVKMKVNIRQQNGLRSGVSGSICAQYECFDYSSKYKKDCYRIVLFKRNMDDEGMDEDMDEDGSIPLSRSSFVVPLGSKAMLDLDLMIDARKISSKIHFASGSDIRIENITQGEVEVVLEWSEVE